MTPSYIQPYRGRFAPSPTGPLHKGSLVAAIASYLEAKTNNGTWLVRMEDVDELRNVKGAADSILKSLEAFGFEWDEEIIYQTQRKDAYQEALEQLQQKKLIYPCTCSRKKLRALADQGELQPGPMGYIYPGTCITRSFDELQPDEYAVRIKAPSKVFSFDDALQGKYQQNLKSDLGDFVVRRRDELFAYQLAVVVDDEFQDITHVVRGIDIIDSTPRQLFLQDCLNYKHPHYTHLPVILNEHGDKLSKQTGAEGIGTKANIKLMIECLKFLKQPVPDELLRANLKTIWEWAFENWNLKTIQG